MIKKILSAAGLIAVALSCFAQNEDDDNNNIIIKQAQKEFRFVKGNADNPVQIKEQTRESYFCNNYRASVPVVEFYNDMNTIDDVDIEVNGSKKHGITPVYEYYNSDGVFYSDAHVCYFSLPLTKQGSTSEVTIKKTTLDPRYFTSIYFAGPTAVQQQDISLVVPDWMNIEIKEFNFKNYNIKKEVNVNGSDKVYTYHMNNLPALKSQNQAPGPSYIIPHILVLCKSATPKDEKLVYFNTVKEQYAWYKKLVQQVDNDLKFIKEKTEEIVKGKTTDEEKVKAIYQWVQDNIRYIAFENGIAGFKPEKAQEVMRKKYGDCKGMANLLTEMLRSIKLDARRCWIGTKHIAYDYSTPSLSVDNHMICVWINKGKMIYLDGTEKYSGLGEVAERIQGRQTLIENGNDYLLEKVPVVQYTQNTSYEQRKLQAEGNNLKGHVIQTWKGESKQWLLSALNDIKQEKQETALKQFLAEGKHNFEISNFKITNITDYNADLKVEYDVLWKDALTAFDKDIYTELDNRKNLEGFTIDTAKRKEAYWFSYKKHWIFETELTLPADKVISTLPEKISVKQPGYSFAASYTAAPGKVLYRNEISISNFEIKPELFSQWNKDIGILTEFYNQQIVLTTKK
jgi:transglutaminase-like putative cysteine protease